MLNQLPQELKALKQWVSVDIKDDIKIPYISGTDFKASTTNPDSWRSFDEAVNDVVSNKRPHIGFVFTENDPFVFIDLDNPEEPDQQKVLERFNTYAQRSISGNGIHLICKGKFKGAGRHPSSPKAGIFQTGRYALMTGDVYNNRSTINTVDDEDLQSIHTWLSSSKEYPATELEEVESNISDDEIFVQGCKRYHRFEALTDGEWEQFAEYHDSSGKPDHSEADHALISMLCDLTPSNAQVRDLFSRTGMWTAERAEKKKGLDRYVNRTIAKIRSKQVAEQKRFAGISLDFTEKEPAQVFGARGIIDSMPEGLLKRVCDWGHRRSEYPLQESALAAAFTMFSTVCGRNYQTYTRSGLNVWIILLADTGTGKNDFQNIIGATVKKVSDANKFGGNFTRMFSGELASGQAVEDVMATRNRCMCYFPEFDAAYHDLTTPNAAPHYRSLKKAILNAYMQSGQDGYISRRLKARQKGEDTPDETPILSPLVILAGECTAGAFFKQVSLQDASTGFLQRFSILQSKKESVSNRPSKNAGMEMPEDLIDELLELFVHCDQLEASGEFIKVEPDKKAYEILQQYRHDKKDASLMNGTDEITKQFYTRAGLKVIRYATILAISENWRNPVIKAEHAEWAIAWVDHMDNGVLDKFQTGELGGGQVKQESEILGVFNAYAKMSTAARKKAGIPEKVAENKKLLPHLFLKKKVVMLSSFSDAQGGAVSAFEKCLMHMAGSGQIIKMSHELAESEYQATNLWALV